ncbi:MAG: FAD-binding protein, partial [Treponema sp.]|nr:FAD-binding protein [Treponema sp.]
GDIALCEASHSLQEFFHLVSIGVDFPHNCYGEFAGYKTDHDHPTSTNARSFQAPLQRASSVGPYTSKLMTEKLEAAAFSRNINIIDKTRVIKLLVDKKTNRVYGLVTLKLEHEKKETFCVYYAKNIIFATGGNPAIYHETVYPLSQYGASGILMREGVHFANMTEWQYGIGSVKFRWNLSGSYQQVIPRYISLDENGNEDEFLVSYFSSAKSLQKNIFLKGYQWPFDPAKIKNEGSSLVDMAVYIEKHVKGKRVFLDYTRNPKEFLLNNMDETAFEYLLKSDSIAETPIERLLKLNSQAYDLYKSNGIDLKKELLEIDVLPQHHNGGAEVNIWWESSIKHLYAIGECAGTHGIHRPGGSALNSGQVGGFRAAYKIANTVKNDIFFSKNELGIKTESIISIFEKYIYSFTEQIKSNENYNNKQLQNFSFSNCFIKKKQFCSLLGEKLQSLCKTKRVLQQAQNITELLNYLKKMNSRSIAFIRPKNETEENIKVLESITAKTVSDKKSLPYNYNIKDVFALNENLFINRLFYNAVNYYIKNGGKSRGSYIILDSIDNIKDNLMGVETDTQFKDKVLITIYNPDEDIISSNFRSVRPIPENDTWFEKVWLEYREGKYTI